MNSSSEVEKYIRKSPHRELLQSVRQILLEEGMQEAVKWGAPIYMVNGRNVIGLASMKNFASIWFHQGVFLKDDAKVLVNAQEGKTKALRQWRMKDELPDRDLIRAYVRESIENEKMGKRMKAAKRDIPVPKELEDKLNTDAELKNAFENLPNGKKNEFKEYMADAKRAETKMKRLEKIIPLIKSGIGLHDRYRKS